MIAGTPRGLLAPGRAERLATLRILVVGFALAYLIIRLPHLFDVIALAESAPARFEPVGPLVVLDAAPAPVVGQALLVLTILVGPLALAGWRWRITGPTFAVGVLLVLSHRNSWGQIFHTENLLVIHLLVLAASPAADVMALGAPRQAPAAGPRYGWPAQIMVVSVVVAYVLAGWAKLRVSGWGWGSGDVLANLVAHDALRKDLVGSSVSPVAALALEWRWIFGPVAAASLAVELLAPVALLGGRWRLGWVLCAMGFHLGVLVIMGILFPYQLLGVAFASFVTVETLTARWGERDGARAILTS